MGLELGMVPPSDKTLKTAMFKPVTQATADRVKDIVITKLADSVNIMRQTERFAAWESLNMASNGASWFPAMLSFRDHTLKDQFPNSRAEKFIHQRVTAELELLTKIRELSSTSKNLSNEHQRFGTKLVLQLLAKHTFVDKHLINMANTIKPSSPNALKIQNRFLQEVRIDFYYNLLSNLSLDALPIFAQAVSGSPASLHEYADHGIFGLIAPQIGDDGKVTYPFARLLERWKYIFSDTPDKPLSWREIARAIPHPSDEKLEKLDPRSQEYRDVCDVAMETKKKRLQEWRSGVSPQTDQLIGFVKNLVPEGLNGTPAWFIGDIAISWGRLIDGEMKASKPEDAAFPIEKGLLFRFEDVWEHYKGQAASMMAT